MVQLGGKLVHYHIEIGGNKMEDLLFVFVIVLLIAFCLMVPVSADYDGDYDSRVQQVLEYSDDGSIIVVDLDDQHVYFYLDGEMINDSDCVSGDLYDSPTPTGIYNVWYKESDYYMKGSYYTSYATFFNGNIAIHDADAWRDEYGGSIYEGDGSHGCINVPGWFAEIVYKNSWIGLPVYVF